MTPQELYDRMKKVQEPKGYYFNTDKERSFELLEALLVNKERYGYMGCPCRLVSGQRTRKGYADENAGFNKAKAPSHTPKPSQCAPVVGLSPSRTAIHTQSMTPRVKTLVSQM